MALDNNESHWPRWHDDTLNTLQGIDVALARLQRTLLVRWAIVTGGLIVMAIFLAVFEAQAVSTADRAAALATKNHQLAHAIQRQRYDTLVGQCLSTNARNVETIRALDEGTAKLAPSRRAQAEIDRAFTIKIINALAPTTLGGLQGCQRKAAKNAPPGGGDG